MQCFECFEEGTYDEHGKRPACSKLTDSPEFKVNCTNSTMCVKEVHSINLSNGQWRTMERRGCAKQVNVTQVEVYRAYVDFAFVAEPYKEECVELPTEMRTSTIKRCYCRGNLCNSSTRLQQSFNNNSLIKIVCVMFLLSNLRLITVI
ncbi:uncharacterized protein LOC117566698 [Drosophila albomicans]|uniref:Uncharacterized protein LOC117566698 n=1 Tax=Drosophila albomicans TaxID=7291 RepID=A0A6P8WUQ8_DROAB|nr:uncharacterized protein LOC117566698 [Drosophila albomicans]